MIENDKLQERLQEESYKIISESITEEEIVSMQLTKEQIIPTIRFFKEIQKLIINNYLNCEHDDYFGKGWINFCFDFEEVEFVGFTESSVDFFKNEKVNFSFLNALCENADIEFIKDDKR